MSSPPRPVIRNLIVCEEIVEDPNNAKRISLVNLIHRIRALEEPPYPLLYRQLCVYVQLTGCRGPAEVKVEIREADTDTAIVETRPRTVRFPDNPLSLHGLRFRILDCRFPAAGLYWVRFWYENEMLVQQPIVLC
jgi:hypothetical protein